jgi:hypothetical protein
LLGFAQDDVNTLNFKINNMTNKTTHYQFILDRSGSMVTCIDSTIEGFNHQLNTLKELKAEFPDQEFSFSLTTFNSSIHLDFRDSSVGEAPCLTKSNYVPSGGTALLDAIGTSIGRLEEMYGADIEADKASVVCVILTDGEENSSKNYSTDQIRMMISRLQETEKWSFNFLGAGIDAWRSSDLLGISRVNSVSFEKSHVAGIMSDLGSSMRTYMMDKSEGKIRKDFLDSVD